MSGRTALVAAVLSAFFLGRISPASTAMLDRPDTQYEPVPCWFDVESDRKVDCGELTVPENWDKAETHLLHLPVVTFRANSATLAKEPIVLIRGGPGGRSYIRDGEEINGWLDLLRQREWSHDRDFIVFAQRGTNWTDSNLVCSNETNDFDKALDWREKWANFVTECGQQLAAIHDLSGYNSVQSALDIATLRIRMGISSWSIYAGSYGARFTLTLLRHHPEGIRSVILESPASLRMTAPTAAALEGALARLFADCASDRLCREYYPDLEDMFTSFMDKFQEKGMDPSGLISYIHESLKEIPEQVPEIIQSVTKMTEAELKSTSQSQFGYPEKNGIVFGASVAILCNDKYPLPDYGMWKRQANAYPRLSNWMVTHQSLDPCPHWPVSLIAPAERSPVVSDVPTLLLSGALDPATPPAEAEFDAATLERSQLVIFPWAGHGVLDRSIVFFDHDLGLPTAGTGWIDRCASQVVDAFLKNPETRPAVKCLESPELPDFSPSLQLRAYAMLQNGAPIEAERILHRTLAYQEEGSDGPRDKPKIATTLYLLGRAYLDQSLEIAAKRVLERAVAVCAGICSRGSTPLLAREVIKSLEDRSSQLR